MEKFQFLIGTLKTKVEKMECDNAEEITVSIPYRHSKNKKRLENWKQMIDTSFNSL